MNKWNWPHGTTVRIRRCVHHAIGRCYNPEDNRYYRYGARGIRVHKEWYDDRTLFAAYLLTLPGCYDTSLVLDRIDNNGHYEPGNLEFVTPEVSSQNRNRYKCKKKQHKFEACVIDGRAEVFVRMHDSGYTYRAIASETGESYFTIYYACKKWRQDNGVCA